VGGGGEKGTKVKARGVEGREGVLKRKKNKKKKRGERRVHLLVKDALSFFWLL
jgi:hypothetical protein